MHGFTFPAIIHILHKKYTDFPEANFVTPVVDRWKNGWLIYIYRTLLQAGEIKKNLYCLQDKKQNY